MKYNKEDDTVTIPVDDYLTLLYDSDTLLSLQFAGADNWSGCDEVEWPNETLDEMRERLNLV